MTERERLEQAIAALEAQRRAPGDAVVEAALSSLRAKLAVLAEPLTEALAEPGLVEARHAARE
jgi:hypothetical protein